MVAQEIYKPTCKMPFVTTGIQLGTNMYRPDRSAFYRQTTAEYVRTGYCLHCGNPFWIVHINKERQGKFCSLSCRAKYYRGKVKEENLKVAYKNCDKKEFTEFYKKYQNYVYSEIYKYESEYHEDLIDIWQEQAIRWFYLIQKWELQHRREGHRFGFLRKAVYFRYLELRKKKLKNAEVFYDECGMKTQQMIFGDYNSLYD